MKTYTYYFVDGTVNAIEISDEWFDILTAMDKRERLNDRQNTRRHVSLDYMNTFDLDVEDEGGDPLVILIKQAEEKKLKKRLNGALAELLPEQHQLLTDVYVKNLSMVEIAEREKVKDGVIRQRMFRIIAHLRNVLID
jgi:RNA polymerase sigma factor (sigma-70 family)